MRHTCSTCGYCKSGVLLSEVSNGREDPCETCEAITVNEFTNWRPIPTTNADRIREMSDEELAEFLERVADGCDSCPILKECTYSDGEMSEEQVRLIWLKQEADI